MTDSPSTPQALPEHMDSGAYALEQIRQANGNLDRMLARIEKEAQDFRTDLRAGRQITLPHHMAKYASEAAAIAAQREGYTVLAYATGATEQAILDARGTLPRF